MNLAKIAFVLLILSGCVGTTHTEMNIPDTSPVIQEAPAPPKAPVRPPAKPVRTTMTKPPAEVIQQNAPKTPAKPKTLVHSSPTVSKSAGLRGQSVLLWPRLIPSKNVDHLQPTAAALQARTRELIQEAIPGKTIDQRPSPERSCPQGGCEGIGVGVLLLHSGGGCAAIALLSGPGRSTTQLIPWAGSVQLKNNHLPFREPPESHISVRDFVPCDRLLQKLSAKEEDVVREIRTLYQSSQP